MKTNNGNYNPFQEREVEEVYDDFFDPEDDLDFGREFAAAFEGDGNTTGALVLAERSGRVEHRDIGAIEPTEMLDGVEVINRTKNGISPFVPIVKTPNFSANSGNLTGYSVEVEDAESKTGYRHLGNVSSNYLLLNNSDVRELALEIAGKSGMDFKESRVFWDGSRFCHIVDFLGVEEEVEKGDGIGLSLVTRNSYDKSWRFESCLMGKRFVCDNGCLSGEFFARVSFKHLGGDDEGKDEVWKNVVREGLSLVHRAPENLRQFVEGLRMLKAMPMNDHRLREVWRLFPTIGDSLKGQIVSRYVEREEPTLFGLFNAGTNVFWHREKMTASDFSNNDEFTTGLLRYAFDSKN